MRALSTSRRDTSAETAAARGRRTAALSPGMSIRREPFGGLMYSFETRTLRVVRSRAAIEVALGLDAGGTFEIVSSRLVVEGLARSSSEADAFVEATVERFRAMGVMSWTTR
jgi:putative mycofactocin binding protein MftB